MQFTYLIKPGSIARDVAPDKRPSNMHFDVINFDSYVTSRSLSFSASKGTSLHVDMSGYIIGQGLIEHRLFLFVKHTSLDGIYELVGTTIKTIKTGKWNFSLNNPILSVGVHETSVSNKLYFVDGLNQARVINVDGGSSIPEELDFAVKTGYTGPITAKELNIAGATNAKVQYAYSLYVLGGTESQISSFTPGVTISKENASAEVTILLFKVPYSYIRVYRLKYETYKGAPSIDLIVERAINSEGETIVFVDDGNLFLSTVSVSELNELGSDFIIPEAIGAKKQTLLLGNFKLDPFRINNVAGLDYYDPRAYSTKHSGGALGPVEDIGGAPGATEIVGFMGMFGIELLYTEELVTEDFVITRSVSDVPTRKRFDVELAGTTTLEILASKPEHKKMISVFVMYKSLIDEDLLYYGSLDVPSEPLIKTFDIPYYIEVTYYQYDGRESNPEVLSYNFTSLSGLDMYAPVKPAFLTSYGGYEYYATDFPTTEGAYIDIISTGERFPVTEIRPNYKFMLKSGITREEANKYEGSDFRVNAAVTGTKRSIPTDLALKMVGGVAVNQDVNSVDPQHDAINPDVMDYMYQLDGATIGAEGPNIALQVKYTSTKPTGTGFKKGETYRFGVVFKDAYGRETPAYWVVDQYMQYSRHQANYYLVVYMKVKSMPPGAVSARFVVVERKESDKSVLGQGVMQPIMVNYMKSTDTVLGRTLYPHIKRIVSQEDLVAESDVNRSFEASWNYTPNSDYISRGDADIKRSKYYNAIITPEVELSPRDMPISEIRAIGTSRIKNGSTLFDVVDTKPAGDNQSWSRHVSILTSKISAYTTDENNNPKALLDDWDKAEDPRYLTAEYYLEGRQTRPRSDKDVEDNTEEVLNSKFLDFDNVVILKDAVVSTTNYPKFIARTDKQASNLFNETTKCIIIETGEERINYKNSMFVRPETGESVLPIVDFVNSSVANQYGGQSYFTKSSNLFIIASSSVVEGEYVRMQGDTYRGKFSFAMTTDARNNAKKWNISIYTIINVDLESSLDPDEFNQRISKLAAGTSLGPKRGVEAKQYWEYEHIFSQIPNQIVTSAKPANFIDITEYPSRIVPSVAKRAGEPVDSWTNILKSTYLDLDIKHGPISVLSDFQDSLLAFQTKAIATVDVYPKAQTSSSSGQISLGTGSVLDDYRYIKVETGTVGKFNVVQAGKSLFYIDTWNKSIQELTEGDIGAIKGFNSMLNTMIPNKASYQLDGELSLGAFLNENKKEVHFKVGLGLPTLVYNYESKLFTSRRSYTGNFYVVESNKVLSSKGFKLYSHDTGDIGNYYEATEIESVFEFRVEPAPGVDKVFDAIVVHKEGVSNFTSLTVKAPFSSAGVTESGLVATNFKSKFDVHTMHLPRIKGGRERWRTKQIWIKLNYKTNKNESFSVDYIDLKFSVKKQ